MNCSVCNLSGGTHVDHIIPVSMGGSNDESNLQPLCHQCNLRKGNRKNNDQLFVCYSANRDQHIKSHARSMAMVGRNHWDGPSPALYSHFLEAAMQEAR